MIDILSINDLLITAAWAMPMTTGLTEVVKLATNIQPRYVPALSLGIGLVVGMLIAGVDGYGAITGAVLGLGSTGLFELGKTTVAGKSNSAK